MKGIFSIYCMLFLLSLGIAEESPWQKGVAPLLSDSLLLKDAEEVTEKSGTGSSLPGSPEEAPKKPSAAVATKPKVLDLRGVVIASADKAPLGEVSVTILQNSKTVYTSNTNQSGLFRFNQLPKGTYQIELQKKGYLVRRADFEIPIEDGLQEYTLKRPIKTLAAIKVKKSRKRGSLADALNKRKATDGVVDGVSAEQIAKSTDSDAGAIAKRVTGASVVGGKYVFVRGLGERYTNMTLNGLPVPSPETDKRVVPQDLFPASSLESFFIYKTFTPNLPSDFAGGSLALVTKGIPSKNFFKVSASLGGVDYTGDGQFLTWGQDRLSYDGGSGWQTLFGYDDGTRQRPNVPTRIVRTDYSRSLTVEDFSSQCPSCEVVLNSQGLVSGTEAYAQIASQFNNKWDVDTATVLPNQSYGLSIGKNWKLGEDKEAGMLLSFSYKNKFEQSDKISSSYTSSVSALPLDERTSPEDSLQYLVKKGSQRLTEQGKEKYTVSGFMNWGLKTRDHELWWKNLYASLTDDKTAKVTAVGAPGNSTLENAWEERFILDYRQRDLFVTQLGGGHFMGLSILDSLSWATGYAFTRSQNPDKKRYFFTRSLSPADPTDTAVTSESFYIDGQYVTPDSTIQYTTKASNGTRAWEELQEWGVSGRLDAFLIVPPSWIKEELFLKGNTFFGDVRLPKVQTGFLSYTKQRSFDILRYSWDGITRGNPISDETVVGDYDLVARIHEPDAVAEYIRDNSRRGFKTNPFTYGSYTSSEFSLANYWNTQWQFKAGIPLKLFGGVRSEWYVLDFKAPFTGDSATAGPGDTTKTIQQNEIQLYYSAGFQQQWTSKIRSQISFATTRIRPEIRERIPTRFYDSENNIFTIGNPELKDTEAQSWDFRLDYFLPFNQLLSVSLFYKLFTDPIESVIDAESTPTTKRFQNSKEAFVRGVEFETLLQPAFWFGAGDLKWWKGWQLYGNVALIESEVTLDSEGQGVESLLSFTRPLKGQSEYLLNLKLSHDVSALKIDWINALLYNVYGDRVAEVGSDNVDAYYEAPFPSLDYLLKADYGRFGFKFQVKNILNSEEIVYVNGLDAVEVGKNTAGEPITETKLVRKEVSRDAPGIAYSLGVSVSW
jgi:hypothetical protein